MTEPTELPADHHSNSAKMGVWPFEGQEVSRKSAVAYIAEIALPQVDQKVARKRVGQNLRDASKTFAALTSSGNVTYPAFWFWAAGKWAVLRTIQGYPTKPARTDFLKGDVRASEDILDFVIPSDLARAQRELNVCQRRAGRLNRALLRALAQRQRLKSALMEATYNLAYMEAVKEDESRNHSVAGKKAAGIPKRRF